MPHYSRNDHRSTYSVYCAMMALLNKSSVPPTHREIAREAHIAASTVVRHLDRLETWGYIRRLEGVKRGIELTYKPWEWDAE